MKTENSGKYDIKYPYTNSHNRNSNTAVAQALAESQEKSIRLLHTRQEQYEVNCVFYRREKKTESKIALANLFF